MSVRSTVLRFIVRSVSAAGRDHAPQPMLSECNIARNSPSVALYRAHSVIDAIFVSLLAKARSKYFGINRDEDMLICFWVIKCCKSRLLKLFYVTFTQKLLVLHMLVAVSGTCAAFVVMTSN